MIDEPFHAVGELFLKATKGTDVLTPRAHVLQMRGKDQFRFNQREQQDRNDDRRDLSGEIAPPSADVRKRDEGRDGGEDEVDVMDGDAAPRRKKTRGVTRGSSSCTLVSILLYKIRTR